MDTWCWQKSYLTPFVQSWLRSASIYFNMVITTAREWQVKLGLCFAYLANVPHSRLRLQAWSNHCPAVGVEQSSVVHQSHFDWALELHFRFHQCLFSLPVAEHVPSHLCLGKEVQYYQCDWGWAFLFNNWKRGPCLQVNVRFWNQEALCKVYVCRSGLLNKGIEAESSMTYSFCRLIWSWHRHVFLWPVACGEGHG